MEIIALFIYSRRAVSHEIGVLRPRFKGNKPNCNADRRVCSTSSTSVPYHSQWLLPHYTISTSTNMPHDAARHKATVTSNLN